jgi:hypothetical protein
MLPESGALQVKTSDAQWTRPNNSATGDYPDCSGLRSGGGSDQLGLLRMTRLVPPHVPM